MRKLAYTCVNSFTPKGKHVYASLRKDSAQTSLKLARVIVRKQDVLQGLRSVYAEFTLAKLIWGRGPLAPDSFLLKRCLRIIYAMFTPRLRKDYA